MKAFKLSLCSLGLLVSTHLTAQAAWVELGNSGVKSLDPATTNSTVADSNVILPSAPISHINRFILGRTALDATRDGNKALISRCDGSQFISAQQLQIKVRGNHVLIHSLVVQFNDGDVFEIAVEDTLEDEQFSKVFELPEERRCIKEIYVQGHAMVSELNSSRAYIQIYGVR